MRCRSSYQRPTRRSVLSYPGLLVGALAVGASGAITATDFVASFSSGTSASCDIKGNISTETGERIFHVPGQKYYSQTKISPQSGERWFCSEFEAWAAGWRKSKV
ncbi:succinoglycan biosynthesis protein exoi [Rhizobium leguminosarum]|uniref:sunset domain-containing protein n=1 Tax=Rhizobium leguminosarum TaxID=384 RepID=UPI003F95E290